MITRVGRGSRMRLYVTGLAAAVALGIGLPGCVAPTELPFFYSASPNGDFPYQFPGSTRRRRPSGPLKVLPSAPPSEPASALRSAAIKTFRPHISSTDAALRNPVPSHRSGRSRHRPVRCPVVCPGLHRRALAWLALLPGPGGPAAASRGAPRYRCLPGLGDARCRAWRQDRLCAVLPARLLPAAPHRSALPVAWRDVVSRRRAGG